MGGAGWEHPAKQQVEAAAAQLGWRRPAWYDSFKAGTADALGQPDQLAAAAAGAGWTEVRVTDAVIDTGLRTPDELVAWRLGMAHLAPFVDSLPTPARERLGERARWRVGTDPPPLRPRVLFCVARSARPARGTDRLG